MRRKGKESKDQKTDQDVIVMVETGMKKTLIEHPGSVIIVMIIILPTEGGSMTFLEIVTKQSEMKECELKTAIRDIAGIVTTP